MTFSPDPNLLVSPVTFQDYMVDKDTGAPLAGGQVNCYVDTERSTRKSWYYQAGESAPYTYVLLPNPLTLTAVGTIDDGSGNDVLPFFYPYNEETGDPEAYYIYVESSTGVFQWDRKNFPFGAFPVPPSNTNPTFRNYIVNNNFWRNIGSADLSQQSLITLAPSQHDGFNNPDFIFAKDTLGATETVTFMKFPLGVNPLPDPEITPEYYLNHTCTVLEAGENYKYYQFPVSLHIKTLDNVQVTVTIEVQSGSSDSNSIDLYFQQYLGTTDTPAPTAVEKYIGTIVPTTSWKKYPFVVNTPSALGKSVSVTGDDAIFLQIRLPTSQTCNINFTLVSLYIGSEAATNDFVTYDQTDAIINSPRTGDTRTTMNSFYPFGWVAANNGTIGTAGSGSKTTQGVWPLYNLLWNNCTQAVAPVSSGMRGTSAYADFHALYYITLPNTLASVLAATNGSLPPPQAFTANSGTSNINLIVSDSAGYINGSPVQLVGGSLPTGLTSNSFYYTYSPSAGILNLAAIVEDAIAGTNLITFSGGSSSGTIQNALGLHGGESEHTQTVDELAAHTHTGFDSTRIYTDGNSGNYFATGDMGSPNNSAQDTTAPTGESVPFNVFQPTTFMNLFFKL